MATIASTDISTSDPARTRAVAGIILISALAGVAMALFSTAEAVEGGLIERLVVPARMALLVLAATLLLRWGGSNWRRVGFRLPERKAKAVLLVIAGYIAVGLGFAVLGALLLPAVGASARTAETFAGLAGNTGLYFYLLLVVAWGSAAFGEELLFRGFLQSRLELAFGRSRLSAALAVLVQAIIFGALHAYQGVGGAILAGATGLIIGLVYLAGGRNLFACILLHGLIDTVSLTVIYLGVAPA